ncbi:MAG: hypothetical protein NVSMB29_01410 [Candidatus Dormibacteria bacterium]
MFASADQCRILLAEDDALIRQLLTEALERSGYCVVAAPDGREALERLEEAQPDVLLTDMVMPHVDGLALLRAVRDTPGYEKLPVLVYTALDRVDVGLENVVVLQKGGRLAPVLERIAMLCEEAS